VRVAEDALTAARDAPGVPAYVVGEPGAGKSAAAIEIVRRGTEEGLTPLLVAPASGAADSGALAVAHVIHRLGGRLPPRGQWLPARKRAAELLHDRSDEILVVCDEPSAWSSGSRHFARRADDAADLLFGPHSTWPTVVCDQVALSEKTFTLPTARASLLRDADLWTPFGEAAASLADAGLASSLRTPLQQRLAISAVAWGADPHLASSSAYDLAAALAELLTERRHGRPLWALWQRLALSRVRLDAEALDLLGAATLTERAAATLHLALLDGAGRLHDVLRRVPESRPVDPELRGAQRLEIHERLFEHHYTRFTQLVQHDDAAASEHASEALYHAGELGDESRQNLVRIEILDELNALGHRLAVVHRDSESASAVFLRAVQTDPDDAYAQHHRAHSLDVRGTNVDEVEERYARALDLNPQDAQWHARQITFFADLARMRDARIAWARAESAIAEDRDDAQLYADLHLPVAAAMLQHGELTFAAYVLDGVPEWARDGVHADLERVLAGRLAAQDEGAFVPAPRSGEEWWKHPPQRLPVRDTEGRPLVEWMAGRVETVDEDGLHVHVARVDAEGGSIRPGLLTVASSTWQNRSLEDLPFREIRPGRFLEIGSYRAPGLPSRTAIALLPEEPVPAALRPLPPERWLR
jgi:tetratricopeptide (TPR) repeat protein